MMLLLEITCCTLLFYGFYHLVLKSTDNYTFNRIFLLSSLAISLVIPLISIPVYPVSVIQEAFNPFSNPLKVTEPTIVVESNSIQWSQILLITYMTGLLIHLTKLFINTRSIVRLIKKGRKERFADHIRVYTNSGVSISSFFHFVFIAENKRGRISDFELEHEFVHIRQKHSLDLFFMEVFRALFWFNPVLLLYRRRLVEVHEFIADQKTSLQQNKKDYLDFLSTQVMESATPVLVHNFYSLFEKRIHMLHNASKAKTWHYLMILPIVVLLMSSFSFTSYTVIRAPENAGTLSDTIGPKSIQITDTIIVFDPENFEESVTVMTRDLIKMDLTDTLISYDPSTMKESMEIRETYLDSSIKAEDLGDNKFQFSSDKVIVRRDTLHTKKGISYIRTLIYH